ncbi:MAG TPA: DUF418 domain-containing protein [Sphingomonas sp.]|jgi:uncharacterized protein|nr:DUF418 domain-containing protein [Sphingomonas sp.]
MTASRITALDVLRGVAVMGILVANMPAFALPEAAYFNPRAWGGTAPADLAVWFATFVLVESKLRALFSMLFGASMLLVVERAAASGRDPASVHLRRMAWLFAIGCMHLYAVWWGDILAHYALCGAIAYMAAGLRVRWLLGIAAVLTLWQIVQEAGLYLALTATDVGPRFVAAMAQTFGIPPHGDLLREVAAYRGDYTQVFAWRWRHATSPLTLLPLLAPETLAAMLVGMAGLKSGFLRREWPRAQYGWCAGVGLGIALPVYAWLGWRTLGGGFALRDVVLGSVSASAALRLPGAIGLAALILLATRDGGWLTTRIAAVGRVAFTNYLATSVVMTTIFYGYGLGLFGALSRADLYTLVPIAWIAMLAWSQPWLARYRHGPLEWMWRSLAQWRVEPMRIVAPR